MSRLTQCPQCDGSGALPFDSGPPAEPCPRCEGAGRLYADRDNRGLFAAIVEDDGVFLEPSRRLVLNGLISLEARVERLEEQAVRSPEP